MTSSQAVSYWLLPCQELNSRFEELSAVAFPRLKSQHFSTCLLPAHITLYSDQLDHREQVKSRLQQLADLHSPVVINALEVAAGHSFTESLVVRFDARAKIKLEPWFQQLRCRSPDQLKYRFDPHLSLLYSLASFRLRQELACQLLLPVGPLTFDRICAVIHPLTISGPEDIASCITVAVELLFE